MFDSFLTDYEVYTVTFDRQCLGQVSVFAFQASRLKLFREKIIWENLGSNGYQERGGKPLASGNIEKCFIVKSVLVL